MNRILQPLTRTTRCLQPHPLLSPAWKNPPRQLRNYHSCNCNGKTLSREPAVRDAASDVILGALAMSILGSGSYLAVMLVVDDVSERMAKWEKRREGECWR